MIFKLKKILGVQNSEKDEILEFYLSYTSDLVKIYCNIDEIPVNLENTLIFLTAEIYKQSENKKRLSMGDVSFEFNESAIFSEYKNSLNKYRKIRW